ncbi:MAG: hypothetical protein LBM00_01115 [Deltaproteobacteria bacterium]|jgi:hypothetical protein|nr:hypothetical protein [Deltaproteobacteria bacterium]
MIAFSRERRIAVTGAGSGIDKSEDAAVTPAWPLSDADGRITGQTIGMHGGRYYRFPHGNLNISRPADVAAKRRESAKNHIFRLTFLRREKFAFQCGYQ